MEPRRLLNLCVRILSDERFVVHECRRFDQELHGRQYLLVHSPRNIFKFLTARRLGVVFCFSQFVLEVPLRFPFPMFPRPLIAFSHFLCFIFHKMMLIEHVASFLKYV